MHVSVFRKKSALLGLFGGNYQRIYTSKVSRIDHKLLEKECKQNKLELAKQILP